MNKCTEFHKRKAPPTHIENNLTARLVRWLGNRLPRNGCLNIARADEFLQFVRIGIHIGGVPIKSRQMPGGIHNPQGSPEMKLLFFLSIFSLKSLRRRFVFFIDFVNDLPKLFRFFGSFGESFSDSDPVFFDDSDFERRFLPLVFFCDSSSDSDCEERFLPLVFFDNFSFDFRERFLSLSFFDRFSFDSFFFFLSLVFEVVFSSTSFFDEYFLKRSLITLIDFSLPS
uniref:SFRICE_006123 n=1 Tax=Spodoptera frugiperda TaxID=7108 RepID=A0A2H1VQX9_SPOFR